MVPTLHFAEEAFTLHLLFQSFKGLIDIVVAHNDLYDGTLSIQNYIWPVAKPVFRCI